ncbi:MAG: pyrimidine dimer DNA glycosylase/endonuclease V, partial [Candidatus Nanoarchaeia archaeon]|nr:pyrimidine dimer DNA glycosylase/endonuclease V [Candidatus Nanoarchaeia archaeon]
MQTFLTDFNMKKNAENLDNKRLGKQRSEGLTIASILLDKSNNKKGWRNHPAVKMWKGYEEFLLYFYLQWIFHEWIKKGFKNE